MANTYAPFGFRSFGHVDGASPTMGADRYFIASSDATAIFTGDPVINSSIGTGGQYITAATTGNSNVLGIFVGCEYYNTNVQRVVWSPYFPGAVQTGGPDVTALVITDPDMKFIVQTSTGAVVTSSYIGLNAGFTSSLSSGGNTTTGVSVTALNSTSVGSTNALPFRILDFYSNYAPPGGSNTVNGTDNTAAGNIVVVVPNNWARNQLTARTS